MLDITDEHLQKFMTLKNHFLPKTEVPHENNWKTWTDNDIWLHLVTQIIVIGGSAPADKFNENGPLKKEVSFEKLVAIENKEKLKKLINKTLRAVGTRYASSDIAKCRKTDALVHNFGILRNFKNGPKGLLERISELGGPNGDKRKIKYLMKILRFIQSKSARDYLMELGLVKNAIALDVRVQKVLHHIGIKIPKGFESDPKLYDEIENDLLTKVCKPLELTGVEFDRMLYQNYKDILVHKLE